MIAELFQRNPPLAWSGAACLALATVYLALIPFDPRTVAGVSPWIKPLKFALSLAILAWTLAWYLDALRTQRLFGVFTWGIVAMIGAELVPITVQAARGVASHFNTATPFDAAMFAFMGVAIALATILLAIVTVSFFVVETDLPAAYLWGIRLGLIIMLAASLEGAYMSSVLRHAVGVADGGPGLPLVNWSTTGGDLRIAHFVGLHALQVLPMVGWLAGRTAPRASVAVTVSAAALHAALALALFLQALRGAPMFPATPRDGRDGTPPPPQVSGQPAETR
ncbi:MAG: hypothetical protein K8W52_15060 [Deltaproteobacteria bacterium]|nr:hypothetical protein [Deltaproteobacteria bacterium]